MTLLDPTHDLDLDLDREFRFNLVNPGKEGVGKIVLLVTGNLTK